MSEDASRYEPSGPPDPGAPGAGYLSQLAGSPALPAPPGRWAPHWVQRLGTAAWISTPELRLAYLNPRAEALLGRSAASGLGLPCFEIVAGIDVHGVRHCSEHCPLLRQARLRQEIEPVELRLGTTRDRWARILVIPLTAPDHSRPWLLHCATLLDRAERAGRFLSQVAARSPRMGTSVEGGPLTPREREILRLLSEDRDLESIAVELGVHYVTVRNHVQHILARLGVHSVIEAVARYVLEVE